MPSEPGPLIGGAVLVHGLWVRPVDWRWVGRLLEDADVQVITPDLPSHRTSTAGLADDAAEVREAIRACTPPVAVVGWSYGGSVISLAAAGEGMVARLIYTSSGGVTVNGFATHIAESRLPFGGVNHSGSGRYHGIHGFHEFSNPRAIVRHLPTPASAPGDEIATAV